MSKLLQGYCIAMLAVFGWVAVGIMAIPTDIVLLDDDLRVQPLQDRVLTEPSDIQPALGYKVINDTYNPQQ